MRWRREYGRENLERWLLTYADLITLLLAFFIMMYTLSISDAQRFRSLSKELGNIFTGEIGPAPGEGLLDIKERVSSYIKEKGLEGWVKAMIEERGLVIRIMTTSFFEEGKADLTPDMKAVLDEIAPMIKDLPNKVQVEGHTDNKPIHNERFRSNWELSVARATEVVRYLIEKHGFPPERIAAIGYGEYRPIAPNDTELNRARNRRVEIVILSEGGRHGGGNRVPGPLAAGIPPDAEALGPEGKGPGKGKGEAED